MTDTITIGGLNFSIADFTGSDGLAHAKTMPATTGTGGEAYPEQTMFPNRVFQAMLYHMASFMTALSSTITGTSSTSFALANSGTVSVTLSTGRAWVAGTRLRFTASGGWVEGVLNSYNSTTGSASFTCDLKSGTGTFSSWTVSLAGQPGATGATGPSGAGTGDMLASNNLSDVADKEAGRLAMGLSYGQLANFARIFNR